MESYRVASGREYLTVTAEIDGSKGRFVCRYDGNIARRNLNDAHLPRRLARKHCDVWAQATEAVVVVCRFER